MNQKQRQYAVDRVNAILKQAKEKIKKETLTKGSKITTEELADKLEAAGFTVKREEYYVRDYLRDCFDTTEWDTEDVISEDRESRLAQLEQDAQATKDEIMIGDSAEAVVAIKKLTETYGL